MTRLLMSNRSISSPPLTHTHTHIYIYIYCKCEILYAKRWNFTQRCRKIKSINPPAFYALAIPTSWGRTFKLLPLERSALCWQTWSSVTSVCQYGPNCAELSGCQPVEKLPPIDIHLKMEVVVGMCRHRYCSTLGCCLRRLRRDAIRIHAYWHNHSLWAVMSNTRKTGSTTLKSSSSHGADPPTWHENAQHTCDNCRDSTVWFHRPGSPSHHIAPNWRRRILISFLIRKKILEGMNAKTTNCS